MLSVDVCARLVQQCGSVTPQSVYVTFCEPPPITLLEDEAAMFHAASILDVLVTVSHQRIKNTNKVISVINQTVFSRTET